MNKHLDFISNCRHCGQRYAASDACCQFCGAPLPAVQPSDIYPGAPMDYSVTVYPVYSTTLTNNTQYSSGIVNWRV